MVSRAWIRRIKCTRSHTHLEQHPFLVRSWGTMVVKIRRRRHEDVRHREAYRGQKALNANTPSRRVLHLCGCCCRQRRPCRRRQVQGKTVLTPKSGSVSTKRHRVRGHWTVDC